MFRFVRFNSVFMECIPCKYLAIEEERNLNSVETNFSSSLSINYNGSQKRFQQVKLYTHIFTAGLQIKIKWRIKVV